MELLDSSMDKIADKVYKQLKETIPEDILGKMTVAVSLLDLYTNVKAMQPASLFCTCAVYSNMVPLQLNTDKCANTRQEDNIIIVLMWTEISWVHHQLIDHDEVINGGCCTCQGVDHTCC